MMSHLISLVDILLLLVFLIICFRWKASLGIGQSQGSSNGPKVWIYFFEFQWFIITFSITYFRLSY